MEKIQEWLTVQDIAKELDVHFTTVQRWIKRGYLKTGVGFKYGRVNKQLVHRKDLMQFIKD